MTMMANGGIGGDLRLEIQPQIPVLGVIRPVQFGDAPDHAGSVAGQYNVVVHSCSLMNTK